MSLAQNIWLLYATPFGTGNDWEIFIEAPSGGSAQLSFDNGGTWVTTSTASTLGSKTGFKYTPACFGTLSCVPPISNGGTILARKLGETSFLISTVGAVEQTTGSPYPEFPQSPQDLFLVVLGWYNQCKPVLDAGGQLQYFDYTSSLNGSVEVNTTNTSDKRLFTNTVKPWGQDTILQRANEKNGLMWGAVQGGSYFYVYYNPFLSPLQSETITPIINGAPQSSKVIRGKTIVIEKV